MPKYLIAFNAEWVPELTEDDIMAAARRLRPLITEMETAGVFVFGGGLDDGSLVCSVDPAQGTPVLTDGPWVETKEHLGGFTVIDVATEEEARHWAGKIAVGCGWPQEVHRFGEPPDVGDEA